MPSIHSSRYRDCILRNSKTYLVRSTQSDLTSSTVQSGHPTVYQFNVTEPSISKGLLVRSHQKAQLSLLGCCSRDQPLRIPVNRVLLSFARPFAPILSAKTSPTRYIMLFNCLAHPTLKSRRRGNGKITFSYDSSTLYRFFIM
jgi:hypothetical protein